MSIHCSYYIGEHHQTLPVDAVDAAPQPSPLPILPSSSPDQVASMIPHFLSQFMERNYPCVFASAEMTAAWPATRNWITPEGSIDFGYLRERFGDAMVSVTSCEGPAESPQNYGTTCDSMKFQAFADYWENYIEENYPVSEKILYLKDWHILENYENPKDLYDPLEFFASDWLNEVWEGDDFRFVYMGPKGSFTPLHMDVYGSYSWSVNIIGRKRWRLYPPGRLAAEEDEIIIERGGTRYIEVVQGPGETIFIPSGWRHIVWNLEDTISINHNWFNAANICFIWKQLRDALSLVKQEIYDLKGCDEYHKCCQRILKSNHGMDYGGFLQLIARIWERRVKAEEEEKAKGDMSAIRHLLKEHLLHDEDVEDKLKEDLIALTNNNVINM